MEQLITGGNADVAPPIKDSDTAGFMADVIEASSEVPVIVDFWATWCGPCKQLTPALEKIVRAARGAVRLVKIDVDKNPDLSQQLRIQSIPTVYAFHQGRPVDAFQGALPESQIKAWVDRLINSSGAQAAASPVDEALAAAQAAIEAGDAGSAGAIYGQVLAQEPDNAKALAGLAGCYLKQGAVDKARDLLAGISEEARADAEVRSVLSALELAETAADTGSQAELRAALSTNANDHQARYDLALALYGAGDAGAAVDELLELIRRDRRWNDEAARQQLLKIFEALGPTNPLTIESRRKLSSLLFS